MAPQTSPLASFCGVSAVTTEDDEEEGEEEEDGEEEEEGEEAVEEEVEGEDCERERKWRRKERG